MKKPIILIKLGGSVITHKDTSMRLRGEVLNRLVREIHQAQQESEVQIVVAHGQGSFAHEPAMQYRTIEGFVDENSVYGMAVTQDCAAQLNRIVVQEFLKQRVPAASFLLSNTVVTRDTKATETLQNQVLTQYLEKGLVPVTCGDVLVDTEKGCTIWSAEKVLAYLLQYLQQQQYQVTKIIHVTEVAGVLDAQGQTVPKITTKNAEIVKKLITPTKGFDVTGGMWHKIQESLDVAQNSNIESCIISGLVKDNLYHCLREQPFVGTVVGTA